MLEKRIDSPVDYDLLVGPEDRSVNVNNLHDRFPFDQSIEGFTFFTCSHICEKSAGSLAL